MCRIVQNKFVFMNSIDHFFYYPSTKINYTQFTNLLHVPLRFYVFVARTSISRWNDCPNLDALRNKRETTSSNGDERIADIDLQSAINTRYNCVTTR